MNAVFNMIYHEFIWMKDIIHQYEYERLVEYKSMIIPLNRVYLTKHTLKTYIFKINKYIFLNLEIKLLKIFCINLLLQNADLPLAILQ